MNKQIFPLLLVFVLGTAACKDKQDVQRKPGSVRIVGSDTEMKLVSKMALEFQRLQGDRYDFSVLGGGSSVGIASLIDGEAEIANSSRSIHSDELEQLEAKGISVKSVAFAIDAVAIVCHPMNSVDSISTLQLQAILSGGLRNWKELGGADRPIRFYGRDQASGTHQFLEDRFLRNNGFSEQMIELPSNDEIVRMVTEDTFAIGYVGVAFLLDERGKPNEEIWAMNLYTEGDRMSYSPYEGNAVIRGAYPLVRPLYQYFTDEENEALREFIKFELSDAGQEMVGAFGFYPLSAEFLEENRRKGF
ncbi:MAG: PstS family phosphate ABC transporter substrate-binding protein [Bacteroidetes bacterium]|nr:MAG: PstS family phosphate ABC transporter substrate-binding protein [Bacteroidota bacterium]